MSRYLSRKGTVVLQDFKDHFSCIYKQTADARIVFETMSSLPYYTRAAGILSWANKKVAVSILGGGTRETDTGVFSDVKFRKLREE